MKSDGFILPQKQLSPFVERYWWSNIAAETALLPLDPATGSELHFHFSHPLHYVNKSGEEFSPLISLVRVTEEQLRVTAPENCSLLAVRIRSGMINHLLPPGMLHELPPVADAYEIWGDEVLRLYSSLLISQTHPERVSHIEQFLLNLLKLYHTDTPHVDHLSRLLYYRSVDYSVQDVADQIGFSRRQLQRICNTHFGITPKSYLSTVRFNRVKRLMLLSDNNSYLPHALDNGYFDQAHFIHEFKKYQDCTPSEYIEQFRQMSHFYNSSLPSSNYFASTVR